MDVLDVMEPKSRSDFRGTYPLRWMVPLINVATWVCLLLGPFFFRFPWLCVIACVQLIYAASGVCQVVRAEVGWRRTEAVIAEYEGKEASVKTGESDDVQVPIPEERNVGAEYYHAFVVPNYKEPRELLQSTLRYLAGHPLAKERYIVVLAMEEAEEGHQEKAAALINQFQNSFVSLFFTSHTLQGKEMKGKASNVSFAATMLAEKLETLQVDSGSIIPEHVIVTVVDADAWVHPLYIEEINRALQKRSVAGIDLAKKPVIFAPPVIFERNWRSVAAPSRVQDFSWAALAFQNLSSSSKIAFPLSVYSIPLRLCIEMGFWDTNPESIAEDMVTIRRPLIL